MACLLRRATLLSFVVAGVTAAQAQDKKLPPPPPQQQEQAPPEEDESLKPKEYVFNPLQATKELQIGNFYFKQGKYLPAARRFQEAAKWNPNFAEAYLRLGEAEEKLKDKAAAKRAYEKYIELAPDSKEAEHLKKLPLLSRSR